MYYKKKKRRSNVYYIYIQNIASKQIFARWQAILSVFDFDLEFIEGSQNSIPDFLTREFLQNHSQDVQETAPAP